MRHILLKSGLLLMMLLVITGVKAQEKLYIQTNDGTKSSFALNEIRKVTFPSKTFTVYENNGNTQPFPFVELRQARFTEWLTGNASLDQQMGKGLALYPNPVSNNLTVMVPSEAGEDFEIRILDGKGNTVFTQTGHTIPGANYMMMPLTHLSKGLYVCRVNMGKSIHSGKFIKN